MVTNADLLEQCRPALTGHCYQRLVRQWSFTGTTKTRGRPQGETTFASTVVSDSGFTVENLAHDFPPWIIYRRRGADSLVARIEGPGPNGLRGVDFPMRRVACEEK